MVPNKVKEPIIITTVVPFTKEIIRITKEREKVRTIMGKTLGLVVTNMKENGSMV